MSSAERGEIVAVDIVTILGVAPVVEMTDNVEPLDYSIT